MAEKPLYDGFTSLAGGIDSLTNPSAVPENKFVRGVNIDVVDGLPMTRRGWAQLVEFAAGKFQGAAAWALNSGHYIVTVVAGVVYVYDYSTDAISSIGSLLDATKERCFFTQVDEWMVIQDDVSRPVVLRRNDAGAFILYGRNPPEISLVVGSVGAYAHRRYHYVPKLVPTVDPAVDADGTNMDVLPVDSTVDGHLVFVSSDIRDPFNPEWVFRMAEHRTLNEGSALALPEELGFITAIGTLRGAATGTGIGEIVVFAREGVSAFDLSFPRTQWKDVTLSRVQFRGAGTVSPFSLLSINNDLLYVDTDGFVRRYSYDSQILNGSGGSLSNIPISRPMKYYIDLSDHTYLPAVSASWADNRFLWTLKGEVGPVYKGMGLLDTTFSAVFGGIWTGYDVQQTLSARFGGEVRNLVVAKQDNRNILLMLDRDLYEDPRETPIESILVTRSMSFKDIVNLKVLQSVTLRLSNIRKSTDVSMYYRPKGYPGWTLMQTREINVPGGAPQTRSQVKFSVDMRAVGCDSTTQQPLNVASEFQFAIVWTGWCSIDQLVAVANVKAPSVEDVCAEDNPDDEVLTLSDEIDDFRYRVTL